MSKGIKLHPKYGLNPTLCVCFYCGKDTGEIAMLGNSIKGEAPKRAVTSVCPCDNCAKKFGDSLIVLEADDVTEELTGRWVTVNRKMIDSKAIPEDTNKCIMRSSDFSKLLELAENPDKGSVTSDKP